MPWCLKFGRRHAVHRTIQYFSASLPTNAAAVLRIEITEIIPARAGPLRHGVRFAHGAVGQVQPILGAGQRRLAVGGGLVIFQRRRQHRQRAFRQRFVIQISGGVLLPNDRKRLAPVTLPAEQPVAQFVIDVFLPRPFSSSQAVIFVLASGVGRPVMEISEPVEFTECRRPVKPRQSVFGSGGWTT